MKNTLIFAVMLVLLTGCISTGNYPVATMGYVDAQSSGNVISTGIESQDIVAMTDSMMRDMLRNPILANPAAPPRVIIDDQYFNNESSSRINKKLITERLLVGLNRASNGRMFFVSRDASHMVERERMLKRRGKVDQASLRPVRRTAGADFRLHGTIASLENFDARTGTSDSYHQITFKMTDLETNLLIWSGIYEFKKGAQTDVLYR